MRGAAQLRHFKAGLTDKRRVPSQFQHSKPTSRAAVYIYWQQAGSESTDPTVLHIPGVRFSSTDCSSGVTLFGLFVSRLEGRLLLCLVKLEFPTSRDVEVSLL